jgi:Conjugal transfer protein
VFAPEETTMKILPATALMFSLAAAGAQTTSQTQVRHVETSLNHLTVLEFGEPVTTLAIGDQDNFQVERNGDKVFIKPLQDGVSTNLLVWTATRELSYELDPAGQVARMDVLVRSEPTPAPLAANLTSAGPSDADIQKIASLVLTQTMSGVEDITHDNGKQPADRINVDLEQVFRAKDRIYIRYSVTNSTKVPFRVMPPDVFVPQPTQQPISLVSLKNHQLTSKTFSAFKARSISPVEAAQSGSGARDLAPGAKATGVVSVGVPMTDQPQLYQFDFGADRSGPVRVEAVL